MMDEHIEFVERDYLYLSKPLIREFGVNVATLIGILINEYKSHIEMEDIEGDGCIVFTEKELNDWTGWKWDKQRNTLKKALSENLIEQFNRGLPIKRCIKLNKDIIPKYYPMRSKMEEILVKPVLDYLDNFNPQPVEGYIPKDKNKSLDPRSFKHIYLIQSENLYKIGIAKDVNRRWKAISDMPYKVNIIAYSDLMPNPNKIEAELHNRYRDKRVKGEWFSLSSEEAEEVKDYLQSLKDNEYFPCINKER